MGSLRTVGEYLILLLGTIITATGLDLFLIPNQLNDGGLTGLAVVAHVLWGWPVGWVLLALNVPLFLAVVAVAGGGFGLRTLVGAVALSLFLQVVPTTRLVRDPLLAALYGGGLSGLGLGLAFRMGGSTGGTDLVARLLRHFAHTTMGQGLFLADAVVILITGIGLGPSRALYSLVALFVGSRVVDVVQEGLRDDRMALIIARDPEDLSRILLQELGRGVTSLAGRGMFTGSERPVLLVAVGKRELSRLKRLVYRHDPRAFVLIAPVQEALGEGFREWEGNLPPSGRRLREHPS